ncbi:MAG: exodeoxyribonuclease VII small subunit [candidate division Zixibacteria bacterium]|jgi:exodeoxyribonuclease VII small subunit|nr:exodeoxyribonuclease VII small subunit [candidate division Zixibacteria bacterium]
MTAQKKYKDYESAIGRLEKITELLEVGEATLEEAIELYTEGLEIARFCSDKLEEAEKKIKLITEKNGLAVEEDFEESDEDEQ